MPGTDVRYSVVYKAVAAAFEALPQRLSVREMAAAAGVSPWSLQCAVRRRLSGAL